MNSNQQTPDISVIVVVGKRYDDLESITRDYWNVLKTLDRAFELIFVLDGFHENAFRVLSGLRTEGLQLKIVRLTKAFGEATALMSGFDQASAEIIVTLPAYYQVEPSELPKIVEKAETYDVVFTRREPRRGGWFESLRRRSFHRLLSAITGYRFNDLGCGVRVLNRRVLEELRLYGDQHRFLPILASNAGFHVSEIDVRQSEKDEFRSRYRVREYLHRMLDIFVIFFLVRFTKKPLRFFGMIGSIILFIGGLILSILIFERMFLDVALADRPAMLLSSLLVVLGLQIISLGLLGELIIFTHASTTKEYKIDQIVSGDVGDDEVVKSRVSSE
jgi:glycosyltransferase involved in cell wall biosynthesis